MTRTRTIALAAGAFLLLAAIAGAPKLFTVISSAQAELDRLQRTALEAADLAAADSARTAAYLAHLQALEDSLVAERAGRLRALAAARRAATQAADSAIEAAPEECDFVVAALEEEVEATEAIAEEHLANYNAEVVRHQQTTAELANAKEGLADAQRALAGLAVSVEAIELPRESLLSRILPDSYVGCTGGVSPITRRADVVCGASVGWKVAL